jgi:hypothetical protein
MIYGNTLAYIIMVLESYKLNALGSISGKIIDKVITTGNDVR